MPNYRHAGDLGDIVYSMDIMKRLGRGTVYLEDSFKTHGRSYTRVRMTVDRIPLIEPLLRAQPYVEDVKPWKNERCDVVLNDFRAKMFSRSGLKSKEPNVRKWATSVSILDWHRCAHGLAPSKPDDTAWLTVPEPKKVAKVVFNRTERYRHALFPWREVCEKYRTDACFIGTVQEYGVFTKTVKAVIPYCPTKDLLEAAQVIAGAELFVGNQSACYALAEGMKKRVVLEVYPPMPNCLFFRDGATHGWSEFTELPTI